MRQTNSSSSTLAGRTAASRCGDIARFAVRVNRALKVDFDRDTIIVTPCDEFDTLRYQEIHLEVGRINDLLRRGGFQNLIVDLAELARLESVLLTALVGFCRSITNAAFCSVSGQVLQSMQLANLLSLWPIYTSRSEAVQGMSGSNWTDAAHQDGDTNVGE